MNLSRAAEGGSTSCNIMGCLFHMAVSKIKKGRGYQSNLVGMSAGLLSAVNQLHISLNVL